MSMRNLKVIATISLMSIFLTGCLFASTWSGSSAGTEFIWKQVPQPRFYVNIIIYLLAFLIFAIKFFSNMRDDSSFLVIALVVLVILIISILRAVIPASVTINEEKIVQKEGFLSFLDEQKTPNMELDWKDISEYRCFEKKAGEKTKWTSGSTTSDNSELQLIRLSDKSGKAMEIPLKLKQFTTVCGMDLVADWLLGRDNFEVSSEQKTLLDSEIQSHLSKEALVYYNCE